MDKEFVSYEQAVALKELGFEYEKFYNYTSPMTNLAPLKQQVFRWFREKHDLLGYNDSDTMEHGIEYSYHINILKQGDTWFNLYIDTYEEAEERCIDKLIKLTKQQDNGK